MRLSRLPNADAPAVFDQLNQGTSRVKDGGQFTAEGVEGRMKD